MTHSNTAEAKKYCLSCGTEFTKVIGSSECPECGGDLVNYRSECCGEKLHDVYIEHDIGGGIAGGHNELQCSRCHKVPDLQHSDTAEAEKMNAKKKAQDLAWFKVYSGFGTSDDLRNCGRYPASMDEEFCQGLLGNRPSL